MPKFRVVDGEVSLKKEQNDIDRFVLKTVNILSKYTDYVIVSGYVAILFGRSRGSEDVDIFIKELSLDGFRAMYEDFVKQGFEWTIDNVDELFNDYLKQGLPIGVWEKNFPLLRLDMKFPKTLSQRTLFGDRIKVVFDNTTLWVASIESTIAYKRFVAKSEKDILDADHLSMVFEGLSQSKIEKYKSLFEQEFIGKEVNFRNG